jgi:hypothetical protein
VAPRVPAMTMLQSEFKRSHDADLFCRIQKNQKISEKIKLGYISYSFLSEKILNEFDKKLLRNFDFFHFACEPNMTQTNTTLSSKSWSLSSIPGQIKLLKSPKYYCRCIKYFLNFWIFWGAAVQELQKFSRYFMKIINQWITEGPQIGCDERVFPKTERTRN